MAKNPLIRTVPKMTGKGTGGHKSAGILDDFATRKVMNTQEGKIEHIPSENNDIVNKKYVDDQFPVTHASTTGQTTDDHHPQVHTIVSHDTTATGTELDTLTDGSNADTLHDHTEASVTVTHASTTGQGVDDHHAQIHTILSHDTDTTGAELTSLADNSIADALHRHSELVASDGSPDPIVTVDADGNVGINKMVPGAKFAIAAASDAFSIGDGATETFHHDPSSGDTTIWSRIKTASGNRDINLNPNGSGDVLMTGNVGIGTASPAGELHIAKSADASNTEIIIENTFNAASSTDEWLQIQGRFGGFDASYILTGKEADFMSAANRKSCMTFWTRDNNILEKMRLTSEGNLGINTILPKSKIQIGESAGIGKGSGLDAYMGRNIYFDGAGWKRTLAENDANLAYFDTTGGFNIYTQSDANATIDSTITLSNRFTVTNGGNVGIGIATPDGKLHVHTSSAGSVTAASFANDLVVEKNNSGGVTILTPDNKQGSLLFGTPSDSLGAGMYWQHDNDLMKVGTFNTGGMLQFITDNDVIAMTIDSSQNVGIGTLTPTQPLSIEEKGSMTAIGGFAIKLTNKTGANSVAGEVCQTSTGTNDAVALTVQNQPDAMGVFLESGVSDGSEAWVVVGGIAEVYFVGTATRGDIARTFVTADGDYVIGQAKSEAIPTSPFATDKHFCEIGHVLQTHSGAGLARCVLHFN